MNEKEKIYLKDFWGVEVEKMIQLLDYVEYRKKPTCAFLRSVLSNDLKGVVLHRDGDLSNHALNYLHFIATQFPHHCYGSEEKFDNWIKQVETEKNPLI